MPKTIELTVEIVVQRVSCPGVWLCQDGSVSLIVSALGTSYETCTLPPTFPLEFNDRLYFRKRFQETCALSNMCCLLKDETLYCELVQWCQNCNTGECNILAQYLGSLSDVLFPPKMCCNDGVDLLMRRSKKYPGILSPKIEIATKVRIDEVWNDQSEPFNVNIQNFKNIATCNCVARTGPRQKTVCHTPEYHRTKCHTGIPCDKSQSRSRSHSGGSGTSVSRGPDKFLCAYTENKYRTGLPSTKPRPRSGGSNSSVSRGYQDKFRCGYSENKCHTRLPSNKSRSRSRSGGSCSSGSRKQDKFRSGYLDAACKRPVSASAQPRRDFCVFNVNVVPDDFWNKAAGNYDDGDESGKKPDYPPSEDKKVQLESRYVDDDIKHTPECEDTPNISHTVHTHAYENKPCLCEICRRYHELFHADLDAQVS
ncbi:uncharacterized protein LOC125226194 isoform X2 [Leguminivora glycinivorella]|uniref:uncharacterized protein LOC125226194 isoform X2 n=1 Tax=Leguminivora glycinivorella TaxID=1035111 RepID=UPI00200DCBF5|nr:uncharacterized protein LOC125226194 isoform X2 [Leguminivora glycinivorella]